MAGFDFPAVARCLPSVYQQSSGERDCEIVNRSWPASGALRGERTPGAGRFENVPKPTPVGATRAAGWGDPAALSFLPCAPRPANLGLAGRVCFSGSRWSRVEEYGSDYAGMPVGFWAVGDRGTPGRGGPLGRLCRGRAAGGPGRAGYRPSPRTSGHERIASGADGPTRCGGSGRTQLAGGPIRRSRANAGTRSSIAPARPRRSAGAALHHQGSPGRMGRGHGRAASRSIRALSPTISDCGRAANCHRDEMG